MNDKIYMGIDPGYDRVGVAIIKRDGNVDNLIYSTCILTDKNESNVNRISHIAIALKDIIQKYNPSLLAIESLFLFKNHKTVIKVAEAIGAIKYVCNISGVNVIELTPMQVKSSVAGNGHAGKEQVEYMVKQILKIDKNAKIIDDELDAMAVALTASAMKV